jgi:general L-amino acid transport system permease protein
MFPLFMPPGINPDKLLIALLGMGLFASAYMAEIFRGGLQAIPKGQYEGAQAVGLSYWKMMLLIIMPQATKIVIPSIVSNFIGLFKDTSLVTVVGILDLLGIMQTGFNDAKWASAQTGNTGYFMLAVIYWVFCFAMSRYSQFIERRLNTGHSR